MSYFRKPFTFLFLLAFFLAGSLPLRVFAASPEFCGDGIDDPLATGGSPNGTKGSCPAGYMDPIIGNGCDKICPGADGDNDGVTSDGSLGTAGTTDIDCDDHDRSIYTGVTTTKGCSAGQHHTCQANGTYTACVSTVLCEATGTGVCKYVDCASGNDSNAGTFASPYRTWGKVSGGSGGSGLPASPYTLQPGDVVYGIGAGVCNTTFTSSAATGVIAPVVGEFNSDGTSGFHVTIKKYPGATFTIRNTDGPGFLGTGDYYDMFGLDISTQRTSANNAMGIYFEGSTWHHWDQFYVHDTAMHGDNNDSCILFEHSNGGQVTHSYMYRCRRQTGNVDNITGLTWLDDAGGGAGSPQCQDHAAYWNTVWSDTLDDVDGHQCFKEKHGCNSLDVGPNKHPIKYNTCLNSRRAVFWDGSSMRFDSNFIWNSETLLYLIDDGANSKQQDNQYTNNSALSSTWIAWNQPSYLATDQHLTISGNVLQDYKTSYVAGNSDGVVSIAGYGSDAELGIMETNHQLSISNNCYYNPNLPINVCYYCQTSGGWGPAGPLGANYGMSAWKALTPGYDSGSFEENPVWDANQLPSSADCTGRGRQFAAASPTPTPTPSPSPSPSPAPLLGGNSPRFMRWRFR